MLIRDHGRRKRRSADIENIRKKKRINFVRDNSAFCLMGYFVRSEKRREREQITERTRLMTVPSSSVEYQCFRFGNERRPQPRSSSSVF